MLHSFPEMFESKRQNNCTECEHTERRRRRRDSGNGSFDNYACKEVLHLQKSFYFKHAIVEA